MVDTHDKSKHRREEKDSVPDLRLTAWLEDPTKRALLLVSMLSAPQLGAQEVRTDPQPLQLPVGEWSFDQRRSGSREPAVAAHSFPAFDLQAQVDSSEDWPLGHALAGALIAVGVTFVVQAARCTDDCFVFWPPLTWIAAGGVGGFVLGALIGAAMSD